MVALSKKAHSILEVLIKDIPLEGYKKFVTDGYMPLSIEWIDFNQISIMHFYDQNGDLMRDPEMTFYRNRTGCFFPATFRQDNLGIYQEAIKFDDLGYAAKFHRGLQTELVVFVDLWFDNIVAQHKLEI